MNKHTKTAFIVAPFLAIGGYIAMNYYADAQIDKVRFLPLSLQGYKKCQIKQGNCILSNGQFQLRLSQTTAGIVLATTHPIDHVVISLVDDKNKEKRYTLKQTVNRLNWQLDTSQFDDRSSEKLRLLVTMSQTRYLAEVEVGMKVIAN